MTQDFEKQIKGIRQKDNKISYQRLKLMEFSYISNIDNAGILFPSKDLKEIRRLLSRTDWVLFRRVSHLTASSHIMILCFRFCRWSITGIWFWNIKEWWLCADLFKFLAVYRFRKISFWCSFYRRLNSGKKWRTNWIISSTGSTRKKWLLPVWKITFLKFYSSFYKWPEDL